jgi:hypothetical protein
VKTTRPGRLRGFARLALGGAAAALLVAFAAPQARASERWATLEAIHQLENPNNSTRPGPCGELGPYQFREVVWRMHSSAPFRRALDRGAADVVAVKHYEWIRAQLLNHGIEPTPYLVALAWNGGIGAALASRPPPAAVDYATRAASLTAQFQGELAANP